MEGKGSSYARNCPGVDLRTRRAQTGRRGETLRGCSFQHMILQTTGQERSFGDRQFRLMTVVQSGRNAAGRLPPRGVPSLTVAPNHHKPIHPSRTMKVGHIVREDVETCFSMLYPKPESLLKPPPTPNEDSWVPPEGLRKV